MMIRDLTDDQILEAILYLGGLGSFTFRILYCLQASGVLSADRFQHTHLTNLRRRLKRMERDGLVHQPWTGSNNLFWAVGPAS